MSGLLNIGLSDVAGDNHGYLVDGSPKIWVCDKDFNSCTGFDNGGAWTKPLQSLAFYGGRVFAGTDSTGEGVWSCIVTGSSPAFSDCSVVVSSLNGTTLRALAVGPEVALPAPFSYIPSFENIITVDNAGVAWWCTFNVSQVENCVQSTIVTGGALIRDFMLIDNNSTALTLLSTSMRVCTSVSGARSISSCNTITPTSDGAVGFFTGFALDPARSPTTVLVADLNNGIHICNLTSSNTVITCRLNTDGGTVSSNIYGVAIDGTKVYVSNGGTDIWVCDYSTGDLTSCNKPTLTGFDAVNGGGSMAVRNNILFIRANRDIEGTTRPYIIQCPLSGGLGGLGSSPCVSYRNLFSRETMNRIHFDENGFLWAVDSFGFWICRTGADGYLTGVCLATESVSSGGVYAPTGNVYGLSLAPF